MILRVKPEPSDSLKRVAISNQNLNNYPLKKRRIKYDEVEHSNDFSTVSSEPENLCTEPQDLRVIKNPPIKQEQIDATPPTHEPPVWFHRSPFTPYEHNHQTKPPTLLPLPHECHQHKSNFILPHHTFLDPTAVGPPAFDYAPPTVKHDVVEPVRSIPNRTIFNPDPWNHRDTVISHGCSVSVTVYRDTVSRSSSCDSGVCSPTGSASSSTSGTTVNPTVVKGTVRHQCPTCAKIYSTVSGLTKHVQHLCGTEVGKSFVCEHCSKPYVTSGSLKMHIKTHTLPCKCEVCGKAFSRPWLLQGHLRTHTGEKPFCCTDCHRAFADRSNLRAHSQTHTNIKKYSCGRCTKTFSRMSLLTKHEERDCFIEN